jgi:hypothetical protein
MALWNATEDTADFVVRSFLPWKTAYAVRSDEEELPTAKKVGQQSVVLRMRAKEIHILKMGMAPFSMQ